MSGAVGQGSYGHLNIRVTRVDHIPLTKTLASDKTRREKKVKLYATAFHPIHARVQSVASLDGFQRETKIQTGMSVEYGEDGLLLFPANLDAFYHFLKTGATDHPEAVHTLEIGVYDRDVCASEPLIGSVRCSAKRIYAAGKEKESIESPIYGKDGTIVKNSVGERCTITFSITFDLLAKSVMDAGILGAAYVVGEDALSFVSNFDEGQHLIVQAEHCGVKAATDVPKIVPRGLSFSPIKWLDPLSFIVRHHPKTGHAIKRPFKFALRHSPNFTGTMTAKDKCAWLNLPDLPDLFHSTFLGGSNAAPQVEAPTDIATAECTFPELRMEQSQVVWLYLEPPGYEGKSGVVNLNDSAAVHNKVPMLAVLFRWRNEEEAPLSRAETEPAWEKALDQLRPKVVVSSNVTTLRALYPTEKRILRAKYEQDHPQLAVGVTEVPWLLKLCPPGSFLKVGDTMERQEMPESARQETIPTHRLMLDMPPRPDFRGPPRAFGGGPLVQNSGNGIGDGIGDSMRRGWNQPSELASGGWTKVRVQGLATHKRTGPRTMIDVAEAASNNIAGDSWIPETGFAPMVYVPELDDFNPDGAVPNKFIVNAREETLESICGCGENAMRDDDDVSVASQPQREQMEWRVEPHRRTHSERVRTVGGVRRPEGDEPMGKPGGPTEAGERGWEWSQTAKKGEPSWQEVRKEHSQRMEENALRRRERDINETLWSGVALANDEAVET